tara:strand:+ start:2113 stop:2682 length:570 start_codon:yes stop_codon:yes gene_type:complete
MSSEVEYKGIKIRGGKLLLIFPLLGSIGAALWAGFEGYARWVAMEDKINSYEAPNISHLETRQDVFEERINNLEEKLVTEINSSIELIDNSVESTRDLKSNVREQLSEIHDVMSEQDSRNRNVEGIVRDLLRTFESDMRGTIDHATDRFDNQTSRLNDSFDRRVELMDTKLKELEERLMRILENPLTGK